MFVVDTQFVDTQFVDTHCSAYLQIAYLQQQQFMPNLFLLSNRHLVRH